MPETDMAAVLVELKAVRAELAQVSAKVDALSKASPLAVGGKSLNVGQTAARLQCERTTVFELLKAGKLKRGKQVGRRTTVTLASIEALETPVPATLPARPKNSAIPQKRGQDTDWDEFRRTWRKRLRS